MHSTKSDFIRYSSLSIFFFSSIIFVGLSPSVGNSEVLSSYMAQDAKSDIQQNPSNARFMQIGETVSAPTGFLELCSRSPIDCIHGSEVDLVAIRSSARTALAQKFMIALSRNIPQSKVSADVQVASIAETDSTKNENTATAQVIIMPRPISLEASVQNDLSDMSTLDPKNESVESATNRASISLLTNSTIPVSDPQPGTISSIGFDVMPKRLTWIGKAALDPTADKTRANIKSPTTATPLSAVLLGSSHSASIASQNVVTASQSQLYPDYFRINMTSDIKFLISKVNDIVNETLIGDTDEHIYHVPDYWVAPGLVPGTRADCEDFALQKRRMLIENGVPAAALSMAVVKTRNGDDHAVLIVSTLQGDFVLDNLQFNIKPWNKTGYKWISRQSPQNDLTWVSILPNQVRQQMKPENMMIAYAN